MFDLENEHGQHHHTDGENTSSGRSPAGTVFSTLAAPGRAVAAGCGHHAVAPARAGAGMDRTAACPCTATRTTGPDAVSPGYHTAPVARTRPGGTAESTSGG